MRQLSIQWVVVFYTNFSTFQLAQTGIRTKNLLGCLGDGIVLLGGKSQSASRALVIPLTADEDFATKS